MRFIDVSKGATGGPRRRPTGPMTPIRTVRRATFTAPVNDPGGEKHDEIWEAASTDGLWLYHKEDEDGTPWTVTYRPTGQIRQGFTSLPDCQRATYGDQLRNKLRAEALHAAFNTGILADDRAQGQRWLSAYLTDAAEQGQEVPVDGECRCGGLLTILGYRGRKVAAHLDGCRVCWPDGKPGPKLDSCVHHFCADPIMLTV